MAKKSKTVNYSDLNPFDFFEIFSKKIAEHMFLSFLEGDKMNEQKSIINPALKTASSIYINCRFYQRKENQQRQVKKRPSRAEIPSKSKTKKALH